MTRLGQYLRDTGTNQAWLARQVHASTTTLSGWCRGSNVMPPSMRQPILDALTARAQIDLTDLLEDQYQPGRWQGGTPYDQLTRNGMG